MKIVRLMGGLGNQVFQYAFGQAWGKDVVYDTSWFDDIKENKNATLREYELNIFSCTPKLVNYHTLNKTNKILKFLGIKKNIELFSETNFYQYDENLLKIKNGILEGYFQHPKYFSNIREKLLSDFIPQSKPDAKNSEMIDKIKSTNSVSIHIRRGDYIKLNHIHGMCDLDYYYKAIDLISHKVNNPHFYIFSDDVKWCLDNLKIKGDNSFIDFNTNKCFWDMYLMRLCNHNIIANSTFSWWGGWLNQNPSKIVIAPKTWLATGKQTDIVPSNWIKL